MSERLDIGAVKSVKIDVLTETGWFDDARLKQDMAAYGGSEQTQYRIAWDAENAGGYAALLTLTLLDGDQRKILLDTGWNTEWMDYVFARHGVDRMLERGEIDFMVLSHWHLDHFWGIESTLKHNPRLKIYAPATWRAEDWVLLKEKGTSRWKTVTAGRFPSAGMTFPTRAISSSPKRKAKTAAASTGCCRAWRCTCSMPRCCCRCAARTSSTSTSRAKGSSPSLAAAIPGS
jgi:hypothetical protein